MFSTQCVGGGVASLAKGTWDIESTARLNELERVHTVVRGPGPGRRWYTEQLNRSLFVALVAQFQVYCRNLHDEAVDVYLSPIGAPHAEHLRSLLTQGRQLHRQNPRRSVLGSDFGRLGIEIVPILSASGRQATRDLDNLDLLVDFRNAIVHGDEDAIRGGTNGGHINATLRSYKQFRGTIARLVSTMDTVVSSHLSTELQISAPW